MESTFAWGRLLDKWHDEKGPAHLLKGDGSPACGVRYFASTGPYPHQIPNELRCRRCRRIEKAQRREDSAKR